MNDCLNPAHFEDLHLLFLTLAVICAVFALGAAIEWLLLSAQKALNNSQRKHPAPEYYIGFQSPSEYMIGSCISPDARANRAARRANKAKSKGKSKSK